MNNIDAAECCFMLSLVFAAGSVASFTVLILNKMVKKSKIYFSTHSFIWLCLFLSGVIASITVMICFTPWRQFFIGFSVNMYYYIILVIIAFVLVFFSRYLFIVFCVCYCLYAGIAYLVITRECMSSSLEIPVDMAQIATNVEITYVNLSPHLFLPFAHTWITHVKIEKSDNNQIIQSSSNKIAENLSNFLLKFGDEKKLSVGIPIPQISPESWLVILSEQNGTIYATLKKLL
jgi:hypothetical protein